MNVAAWIFNFIRPTPNSEESRWLNNWELDGVSRQDAWDSIKFQSQTKTMSNKNFVMQGIPSLKRTTN